MEEREVAGEGGESGFDLLYGLAFYLFGASILRKLLLGFSLYGFPKINLCVLFVWLCLSVFQLSFGLWLCCYDAKCFKDMI